MQAQLDLLVLSVWISHDAWCLRKVLGLLGLIAGGSHTVVVEFTLGSHPQCTRTGRHAAIRAEIRGAACAAMSATGGWRPRQGVSAVLLLTSDGCSHVLPPPGRSAHCTKVLLFGALANCRVQKKRWTVCAPSHVVRNVLLARSDGHMFVWLDPAFGDTRLRGMPRPPEYGSPKFGFRDIFAHLCRRCLSSCGRSPQ